jgi:hypothetical protein
MKYMVILSVCVALVFTVPAVQTQNVSKTPSPCTRDNAIDLIGREFDASKLLDDTVKRITVLIRVADLLWPYQREQARAAFTEGFDLAARNYKERGDESRRDGAFSLTKVPDQRYTVVNAIAKRDPAWARKVIDQMLKDQQRETEEKTTNDTGEEIRTAEKLLGMASALLSSDQTSALSFATDSLRYPATPYLAMFLYKLAAINTPAANQFYQNALVAYADAPMERFLYLSSYPFGNERDVGEMPDYTVYQVPGGFETSPGLQQLFVQLLLRRVLRLSENPSASTATSRVSEPAQMWLALTRLENQIQRSLPDLAPAVEQAKGIIYAQLPLESQLSTNRIISDQNAPKRTFDEQVEAAQKNPNVNRRDQQLSIAITHAFATEDLDHLLNIVEKISDSAVRVQLLNWLYFDRTLRSLKDQKLDDARRLAGKVGELDQRAYLYFRIAEESLKQNSDQTQAREMLEDVVAASAKAPATMVTARALLGVAYLYARIDMNRAIGLLGDAVKCINRLDAPDFSRQFVMRKIEGKTFGSYAMFQTPGFSPENTFREVGKLDFDGTLYQANNFTDKSLRSLTSLAMVEQCLKLEAGRETSEKPKHKQTPDAGKTSATPRLFFRE